MTNLNWGTLVLTLYCLAHGVHADGGHPQDDLVGLADWRYVFHNFLLLFLAKIIHFFKLEHKFCHTNYSIKWFRTLKIGDLCFKVSVKIRLFGQKFSIRFILGWTRWRCSSKDKFVLQLTLRCEIYKKFCQWTMSDMVKYKGSQWAIKKTKERPCISPCLT